jgi:uncharacterized protein YdaT
MQIRGALLDDHTDKNDFPDVWNETPANKRRRAIKDITDYLLVDDFYSELKKRIQKAGKKKRAIFQRLMLY